MKILIDINHPAHVHYFRNLIKIMERRNHEFIVINRNSSMINYLLDYYSIPHIIRNARPKKRGTLRSAMNILSVIKTIFFVSLKQNPDLYLGFANAPSAIVAKILRKPCILLDDTDHNRLNHKLYLLGASVVLTPFYFNKNLGKKQIYFNAFVEQLYLHSNVFDVNASVVETLGYEPEKYALVRYIAYDAHHDTKVAPLNTEAKINLLKRINTYLKVILSTEEGIKDSFPNECIVKFPPELVHHIEAGAKFILTEGGTMATECFLLGVPYIAINPLRAGASDFQTSEYHNMAVQTTNVNEIEKLIDRFSQYNVNKAEHRKAIEKMTIDPTKLLVWFVENYPNSEVELREDSNIQYRFK